MTPTLSPNGSDTSGHATKVKKDTEKKIRTSSETWSPNYSHPNQIEHLPESIWTLSCNHWDLKALHGVKGGMAADQGFKEY